MVDAANRRITAELRKQLGLLLPDEIRARREGLGLTQTELAGLLGIAEATLSRWETGSQIQQRAFDRFMRVVFEFPEVRARLDDRPSSNAADSVPRDQAVSDSGSLDNLLANQIRARLSPTPADGREFRVVLISHLLTTFLKHSMELPERTLEVWPGLVRNEFQGLTSSSRAGTPLRKRWFVAPLEFRGPEDFARANRISKYAELGELLPQNREELVQKKLLELLEAFVMREKTPAE
jgi:DNA-binding transcriptional regulator YiaG